MKSGFNCIKITCLLLACTFALSGCSAGKSTRVQKAERVSKAGETVKETGNTKTAKPAVPEDVRYSYNEVTKTIRFTWNEAENAVKYTVKFMNEPVNSVSKPEYTVKGIQEGDQLTLFIRSVSADNESSDWKKVTCDVKITVGSPEKAGVTADGDYVFFRWSPVENAAGYEIVYRVDGTTEEKTVTTEGDRNYIYFKLVEGAKIEYHLRAYKVINDNKLYSEWRTITLENPKYIPLSEYGYITTCTLDLNRTKEYVRLKGGKLNQTEYNGHLLVEVSLKDEAQHTFTAAAKRFLKDIGEALVEGYVDGVKENAIDTAVESENVKDFVKKLDEEATKNAKKSALKRIFSRTKVDTDMHCIYQYKYTDIAPELVKVVFLKANNKDYGRKFADVCAKFRQKDGSYLFTVNGTGQLFYVRLSENNNYWILTMYPVHVMSLKEPVSSKKT